MARKVTSSEPDLVQDAGRRFGTGHLKDPADARDWRANGLLGAARNLPGEASLEPFVRAVRDQGTASSCVGNAIAQACDVRLARLGLAYAPPTSALAIYTMARALARTDGKEVLADEGSYARLAFKAARDNGLVPEERWPHDFARINDELPWDVLQQASAFRVASWYRVGASGASRAHEVCNAIAQGWPVVLAAQVDTPFMDHAGRGKVPAYDPAKAAGGHMLCLVGYGTDGPSKVFRGVNSWGEGWGDKGLFWAGEEWLAADTIDDVYIVQVAGK